jgi:twitching motility protein PilJ
MASANNYSIDYQQAETAYIQGNYQQAAEIVDCLVIEDSDNAKVHLLRGHVYRRLQDYALARGEYEFVLQRCTDIEIREYAQNGLEEMGYSENLSSVPVEAIDIESNYPAMLDLDPHKAESEYYQYSDPNRDDYNYGDLGEEPSLEINSADYSWKPNPDNYLNQNTNHGYVNPFENSAQLSSLAGHSPQEITYKLNSHPHEISDSKVDEGRETPSWGESDDFNQDFAQSPLNHQRTMLLGVANRANSSLSVPPKLSNYADDEYQESYATLTPQNSYFKPERQENQEKNEFMEDWKSETQEETPHNIASDPDENDSSTDFLEGFGEFGDLSASVGDKNGIGMESNPDWQDFSGNLAIQSPSPELADSYMASTPTITSNESFTVTTSSGKKSEKTSSRISNLGPANIEPRVTVKQGWLRPLENASLKKKSLIAAIASGVASTIAVGVIAVAVSSNSPGTKSNPWQHHALLSLGAGVASFVSTLGLMSLVTRTIRRSTDDLESKLQAGIQGNFNTTAIVFSEDEFGRLATRFNQMAGVMLAITSEAQRKAQEEEQKKEDLQRQVIRLLDDVEGAARGDLTVQAEVTADVLGAVADSFNLTIENLREIVQQVKTAAKQVNQESTASEVFARNLSGDALHQAEELAVTLNSVQVITDSIKRVANNAKEAENVARSASLTALKGGDAVEKTVAGILGIRETVAESTRKVKRLAESSQEISKIVAVISQIASRTNMLALNASIEAARAGEAGRGFAIVADEVRQLADRSAKALKEIEQIVRQIQSDTGSVMTAMEEGTQQVIEGTKLAEKAKRSLEDIIKVSNRIDSLVQSITADTVEQTETSTTVAQVMQSVEMTAQATSQEAQRVSGTLQNLVSVAQDLLNSVERFRVENN